MRDEANSSSCVNPNHYTSKSVPPHLYGQNGVLLLEIHCFNVGNKPFWQLFRSLSHYNIIREQGVHPYDYMSSLLRI